MTLNKKRMGILTKELNTLFRHGSIYGLSDILSRLIGFLMIPLYTNYLAPTDYGIYQLVYPKPLGYRFNLLRREKRSKKNIRRAIC